MGICGSKNTEAGGSAANDQIEENMNADKMKEDNVKKLLLLGAGESGKSTLFKQMTRLYTKGGWSEEDQRYYVQVVHNNCLLAIQALIEQAELWGKDNEEYQIEDTASRDLIAECDPVNGEVFLTPQIAEALEAMWNDSAIQSTYERRSEFQLADSIAYFMGRIKEIGQPDYLPNDADILRCRIRTTGIVETEFEVDGTQFRLFDVGGQRNERKKWIHCFEEVKAVLFVAAISEYDQLLYEDATTNRITEALELFKEISNSRWFKKTSIILFLNKSDLFREKAFRVPLTKCEEFSDFDGYEGVAKSEEDIQAAEVYIQKKFEAQNSNKAKKVYAHVTNATNADNIKHVMNAVKDIVIRQALSEGGLDLEEEGDVF